MEQKIKQDEIFIGKNIRRIRKERGRTFAKEIKLYSLSSETVVMPAYVNANLVIEERLSCSKC